MMTLIQNPLPAFVPVITNSERIIPHRITSRRIQILIIRKRFLRNACQISANFSRPSFSKSLRDLCSRWALYIRIFVIPSSNQASGEGARIQNSVVSLSKWEADPSNDNLSNVKFEPQNFKHWVTNVLFNVIWIQHESRKSLTCFDRRNISKPYFFLPARVADRRRGKAIFPKTIYHAKPQNWNNLRNVLNGGNQECIEVEQGMEQRSVN